MTGIEPAEYFPQLAEADLYVDAGEVTAFLRECELLRENLDVIASAFLAVGACSIWRVTVSDLREGLLKWPERPQATGVSTGEGELCQ